MSSSPITELFLSSFGGFHHSRHPLYSLVIDGAFEYFVDFGRTFPSLHLCRETVQAVMKERSLQMGNVSEASTSPVLSLDYHPKGHVLLVFL